MQNDDDGSLHRKASIPGISYPTKFINVKSRINLNPPKVKKEADYPTHKPKKPANFEFKDNEEEEKIFPQPKYFVSGCWKTVSGEMPKKFVQLFKQTAEDEEDADIGEKKKKSDSDEGLGISLPHTKEFHNLTEVQKVRIMTAVEDTIKKLAYEDIYPMSPGQKEKHLPPSSDRYSIERFFCRKFLFPWVIMKVVEMVLCHIIQLTFLSEDTYCERKNDFIPVVVTYYLTLFIVVASLVVHISCFSYAAIQNPCYFMGVISSSILTLTTSLGILIMLCSMEYYQTFRQILVLMFVVLFLCSLFAELCLCYFEVKSIWNKAGPTEQYYVS